MELCHPRIYKYCVDCSIIGEAGSAPLWNDSQSSNSPQQGKQAIVQHGRSHAITAHLARHVCGGMNLGQELVSACRVAYSILAKAFLMSALQRKFVRKASAVHCTRPALLCYITCRVRKKSTHGVRTCRGQQFCARADHGAA